MTAACRRPTLAASRDSGAYHRATLPSVALWCIAFGRPPVGWGRRDTCTTRVTAISPFARLRIGIRLGYSMVMDQNLCRRCRPMPRPKFGRTRPTTAAAAPATFRLVHLQVVGREQMAIAAYVGYGHGLEDAFQAKAHHISFGCFKARPRYQCCVKATSEFGELRRMLPWPSRYQPSRIENVVQRNGRSAA